MIVTVQTEVALAARIYAVNRSGTCMDELLSKSSKLWLTTVG